MGGYEEFLFVPEEGFLAGSYISSEEGMYVMPIEGGERLKISDDCAERMIYYDGYKSFGDVRIIPHTAGRHGQGMRLSRRGIRIGRARFAGRLFILFF